MALLTGLGLGLAGLGTILGDRKQQRTTTSSIPQWQLKRIQQALANQQQLSQQGLSANTLGNISNYLNSTTTDQKQALLGNNSYLGNLVKGDYLNSPQYLKNVDMASKRITDRFNQIEMPAVVRQANELGRLGSPTLLQNVDRSQKNLVESLGNVEQQFYNQARSRQLQGVGLASNVLGSIDNLQLQRALTSLKLDPRTLQQSSTNNYLRLLGGNYGRNQNTPYYTNPLQSLGGLFLKGQSILNKGGE